MEGRKSVDFFSQFISHSLDPPTSFCFDLSHPDAPRETCVRSFASSSSSSSVYSLIIVFFCFVCVILHPWRHAVVGSFIHSFIHSFIGESHPSWFVDESDDVVETDDDDDGGP